MKILLALCTVAAMASLGLAQAPDLTYTCSSYDVNRIKLTLTIATTADSQQLVASDITATDGEFGDCVSVRSDDDTINTLVIVFDEFGVQKQPLLSTANCYVKFDSGTGLVSVQVTPQKHPETIGITDEPRVATCDPNNLDESTVYVASPDGVDLVTSNIHGNEQDVAKTTLGAVTASLVKDPADTTYFVGDTVKVQLDYNHPAAADPASLYPKALFVYSLIVYGNGISQDEGEIIVTSNGCKGTGVTSSFVVTNIDVPNKLTTSESPEFELKLFKKSRKVVIVLSFEASCYTDPSKCTDQQSYCNLNGLTRKRRAVDGQDQLNGTMILEVPVKLPGLSSNSEANQQDQIADGSGGVTTTVECEPSSMYLILAIILGAFLLVVVVICVILIVRLRNVRDKEVTIVDRTEGHKNPAYY